MTDATVRNDDHFAKETIPISLEDEMRAAIRLRHERDRRPRAA